MTWREWQMRDFTEGIIDNLDDNLLPPNASVDCRNWISRQIGRLEKRKGQKRINSGSELPGAVTGLYAYYKGITNKLIVASKGSVYNRTLSGFEELWSGWEANAPIFFETCANYLVAFNGYNQPKKWDGLVVSDLQNAPADGQYPILHKEKLFVVPKSKPSEIWWSTSFKPEEWPPINYWQVKPGDGDEITCLTKIFDELVIFKKRSVHVLRGVNLDDFALHEVDGNTGCVGNRAAVAYHNRIYFVSEKGIFVFNGMRLENLSKNRIPKLWERVNLSYLHQAAAVAWNGYIWFALPFEDSTINNIVLVLEAETGRFWAFDNINASCFQVFNDGINLKLYSGDYNGYIIQQDIGTEDFAGDADETPVKAYWISGAIDIEAPEHIKKAKKIYVEDAPAAAHYTEIEVATDYNSFVSLIPSKKEGSLREYKIPREVKKWHYLALKIKHEEAGECQIRGIMLRYKVKGKPKINGDGE